VYANATSNQITYQKVQFDENPEIYNLTYTEYGSLGFLLCYCNQIIAETSLDHMKQYEFYDISKGAYENWCDESIQGLYGGIILNRPLYHHPLL
jgi:hypothetical protein